jgi:hypothetical protein
MNLGGWKNIKYSNKDLEATYPLDRSIALSRSGRGSSSSRSKFSGKVMALKGAVAASGGRSTTPE